MNIETVFCNGGFRSKKLEYDFFSQLEFCLIYENEEKGVYFLFPHFSVAGYLKGTNPRVP